jgi:hypothetical protein
MTEIDEKTRKNNLKKLLTEISLKETQQEVNERLISYWSEFIKVDFKFGLPNKRGKFNEFVGHYIGRMIYLEELMRNISLEMISRGNKDVKIDIYEVLVKQENFMMGKYFKLFDKMVKRNFEFYQDHIELFDKFNKLIGNLIQLRNLLAHSYISYSVAKNKKTLIPSHKKQNDQFFIQINYSLKFKKEIYTQIHLVEIYLRFLKDCVFYKGGALGHLFKFYGQIGVEKTKLFNAKKDDKSRYFQYLENYELVTKIISDIDFGVNVLNKKK